MLERVHVMCVWLEQADCGGGAGLLVLGHGAVSPGLQGVVPCVHVVPARVLSCGDLFLPSHCIPDRQVGVLLACGESTESTGLVAERSLWVRMGWGRGSGHRDPACRPL